MSDPAAVPDAVAAVLGITQQPGKSVSECVSAALEGRTRLLVFDNCEHVLDAAADLIEAILAHSATVKVLATSRERLGVADEQLWLVPPLDIDAGTDSAAVSFFVERAVVWRSDSHWPGPISGSRGGDLPSRRWNSVGNRAGGLADGVDDSDRADGSSGSAIPVAGRVAAKPETTPDAAPRCGIGPTTILTTPKKPCWTAFRSSPAALTSKALAR